MSLTSNKQEGLAALFGFGTRASHSRRSLRGAHPCKSVTRRRVGPWHGLRHDHHGMEEDEMAAAALPTDTLGRVLVADDQVSVVEALRLLLKHNGYEVHAVSSPAGVLKALAENKRPFDLLLVDLNYARDTTSGQEGLELVTRVHERDPQLPIMAMTAWSSVPLAVATLREGSADFVEKPWDNDRLLAAVGSHIEEGRRRRRAHRLETDALA